MEGPQIAMCDVECCGRLKCRATGLDASLSSFSTSRRCSRKRSPSRLPVSPIYSFFTKGTGNAINKTGTWEKSVIRMDRLGPDIL